MPRRLHLTVSPAFRKNWLEMRHHTQLARVLSPFRRPFSSFSGARVLGLGFLITGLSLASENVNASLQFAWEPPNEKTPRVLKNFELGELESRKLATLTERDPLAKNTQENVKFQGLSLSQLIEEATKTFSAADRSDTDLVVMKTRAGREALMPKAFLVKYPQIQIALKKNGQPLGVESPRLVLPATTNAKIQKENMLLEPMFVSELASITLSSYERRYGSFFLKRRTDPAAMRGEKLFLQNCITCHTQAAVTMVYLTSSDKIHKVAQGEHPNVPGNHGFSTIFDKKAIRSLVSYLEAFRFQTAKN